MTDDGSKEDRRTGIPWWVKSILLLGVVGVACYKIVITPWTGQFDFPMLLSLLLAFFAVGLSALFYFKATDTSNAFYNNTNKFTQNMSVLLARIESGFGEQLRHLDDSSKAMVQHLSHWPQRIEASKEELKTGEQKVTTLQAEVEGLFQNVLAESQMRPEEKDNMLSQLKEKEARLAAATKDIHDLESRIHNMERTRISAIGDILLPVELRRVFRMLKVRYPAGIPSGALDIAVLQMSRSEIGRMLVQGWVDEHHVLTAEGREVIARLAEAQDSGPLF